MLYVFVFLQFLPFIIVPIIIISVFVKVRKHSKNQIESIKDFKNTISNANDPDSYGNSISSESTYVTCSYCGTRCYRVKNKCPSCGAKMDAKDD